jgi:hypothetical protein
MPESFSRTFQLPPSLLVDGGSATVSVSLTTSADVLQAIVTNNAFPSRPEGKIEMGSVSVEAAAGKDIVFKADRGVVSFQGSAGGRAAIGVYDSPGDALSVISLGMPEELNLDIPDHDNTRHLLYLWGYQAQGSFSESHPIGVLGTVTFGVEGQREAVYAVLHSFPATAGANDVLRSTVGSWKLPRHVQSSDDLAPGTWLISEADGSLALRVNAQLGYNFNFVREAQALGLTGDIGLKLEAGANVALGFEASSKYLVVLGRESMDLTSEQIRLRLFKLSKKGWNFGLNLSASTAGVADILPDRVDDVVQAIFGVHGQQIVKDLQLIDEWTDPSKDLSDTVARLASQTGLDLLKRTTGIDPKQEFDHARSIFVDALKQWDDLPDKVSSVLWSVLPGLPPGSKAHADAMEISRRLQRKLKELISSYYFQDLDNLRQDFAAAALLVYASIPPSTSIRLKGGKLTLNTDKDVYWNWPMPEEREAMMSHPATRDHLTRQLVQAHDRLLAAGRDPDANFFREAETGDFLSLAGKSEGEKNLKSLLFCEAEIVDAAQQAVRNISDFLGKAGNKPQEAIRHLAEFGAAVTTTFNNKVQSIYGGQAIRPLGSMIFLEASCALDPALRNALPNAMLSLTVLKEERQFLIQDFLKNKAPAREDVALEQRLVSQELLA